MQNRLRDLREAHKLTQKELARALHRSQQMYSKYERGISNIPASILILLSRFYHTSVDYLLGLTKDP